MATVLNVSNVDPTVPIFGAPTTASVRRNFQIIHDELTTLMEEITANSAGGSIVFVITGPVPNYTVVPPINYISVRQSGPLTIFLPATPATGYTVVIKDALGGLTPAAPFTIQGSQSIDGAATFTMRNAYQAFTFTYDGVSWGVR